MKYTTFQEFLARLDPDERAEIERGSAALGREYDNLVAVQEAVKQAQAEVAAKLGVDQDAAMRLAQDADLYLKTLRKLVRAMGGQLDVVVRLPGKGPIRIGRFRDADCLFARKRVKRESVKEVTAVEVPARANGVEVESSGREVK